MRNFFSYMSALLLVSALSGCNDAQLALFGTASVVTVASVIPSNDIDQTYYIGVFDPLDQVKPPELYRIRVRGQASATSSVKFGSGWVPAALIDTLGPSFQSQLDGKDNKSDAGGKTQEYGTAALPTKRRFWMFGPEGFREAPKDHRLVIVMGASPEAFFGAIDRALGIVADVRQGSRQSTDLERELFVDLLNSKRERERYTDLLLDLATSN